jgi:hypothetical protein
MKTKMAVFIAAGILASSIASVAEAATSFDSNLAPSVVAEEADTGSASAAELAGDPDPNLGPTTAGEEMRIRSDEQGAPEIASVPDPNLVALTID